MPGIGSHTILNSIPFTKQTDPRQFPPYEKKDYPKMMTRVATEDDLTAWLDRNRSIDDNNKPKYPGGRPIVGKSVVAFFTEVGEPIVVNDPAEEQAFREDHPDALDPEQVAAGVVNENVSLKQKLAELQARLDKAEGKEAAPIDPPKQDAGGGPLQALTQDKAKADLSKGKKLPDRM